MIPVYVPSLGSQDAAYVANAVKSGWVSSKGQYIEVFEKEFAAYCGARHATTASNGTVALHLALLALGIGKGDEIIVPSFTFVGSVNPIVYVGARPVFVDCDPRYWCIDPAQIESRITARTKAIMVVHLYGHPAEMNAIRRIAKKHGLFVIEDAAEAHGATYRNKKVGALSDVAIFSFFGNKVITTGEGGMVTANNKEIIERAVLLKNHGMDRHKRYWHPEVGYNYRMTNMQAALGVSQMKKIDAILAKKRQIQAWYHEELDGEAVTFQAEMPWAKSSLWMVSVTVDKIKNEKQRDGLIAQLAGRGIETRPLFYPVHYFPQYARHAKKGSLPVCEGIYFRGINLPSGPGLSRKDVRLVARELRAALSTL